MTDRLPVVLSGDNVIATLLNNRAMETLFGAAVGVPALVAVALIPERFRRFARANVVAFSVGVGAWITAVFVVQSFAFDHGMGCDRGQVLDMLVLAGLTAASIGAISGVVTQLVWRSPTTQAGAVVALLVTLAAAIGAVFATSNIAFSWSWACF